LKENERQTTMTSDAENKLGMTDIDLEMVDCETDIDLKMVDCETDIDLKMVDCERCHILPFYHVIGSMIVTSSYSLDQIKDISASVDK